MQSSQRVGGGHRLGSRCREMVGFVAENGQVVTAFELNLDPVRGAQLLLWSHRDSGLRAGLHWRRGGGVCKGCCSLARVACGGMATGPGPRG